MPDQLDLNLLRVFDALLQEGSVTAASGRLHLSIPATSRALSRLRRAMGDPILVRAGRGMAPTPFALRTAATGAVTARRGVRVIGADREIRIAEPQRTFTIRINDGVTGIRATLLYREKLVGIVRADSPLGRHRSPALASRHDPDGVAPAASTLTVLRTRVRLLG